MSQAKCFIESNTAVQLSGPRQEQTADDALAKASAYLSALSLVTKNYMKKIKKYKKKTTKTYMASAYLSALSLVTKKYMKKIKKYKKNY